MGIQINGQTDTIRADDGSLILGDQVSASQVTVGLTTFHSTTAFVHNINSTGVVTATSFSGNITGTTASFTGNVSVAGTLTYEDVTNVDSVGLITARNGVEITGGDLKVGTAVTISGGIVTATSYRGDGSQLTGIDASTLKDAGSVTRAQANTSGVQVTGILTATSLVGVLTTTTTNGNIDLTTNGTGLIRVTENNLSQVPIVTQHDIGTAANEIPLNQYLGTAAFVEASQVINVVHGFAGVLSQLASGTELEITGIPDYATRIDICLNGLSMSTTGSIRLQIGNSSNQYASSTANTVSGYCGDGPNIDFNAASTYFILNEGFSSGSHNQYGILQLARFSHNTWMVSHMARTTGTGNYLMFGAGSLYSGGTGTDRLRITAAAGTFDSGSWTVNLYKA